MEEPSINVLVDAKTEYTKRLTNILAPFIYEGLSSIYQEANNMKNNETNNISSNLQIFQDLLRKIPKWNQDIIDIMKLKEL